MLAHRCTNRLQEAGRSTKADAYRSSAGVLDDIVEWFCELRAHGPGGYWEVPLLYPASLLYMVSGLFEDPVVDMPMIGMERYFAASGPYNLPEIHAVTNWMSQRYVWYAGESTSGLQAAAARHGQFNKDPITRSRVKNILRNGF